MVHVLTSAALQRFDEQNIDEIVNRIITKTLGTFNNGVLQYQLYYVSVVSLLSRLRNKDQVVKIQHFDLN